jgi:cytochrome c556
MSRRSLHVLLVAWLLGGCRSAGEPPADASPPAPSPNPDAVLASMDGRTPVPLLPMMANHQKQNMREHLVAVQEITAGVSANDFAAIEHAASRIGFSERMGAMCKHMGVGAVGFSERALAFHHTADGIGEAAKRQDMKAVLVKLNETLAACTSCHATYKQQVVDEATWASLSAHPAR